MRTNNGIWRALAMARRRNLADAGAPPPQAGGEGITRRRAIAALAAGATVPLIGYHPPVRATAPALDVAIIGGGLAGMVALKRLRASGVRAHLFEARGRMGGRVFTARNGPVPADDGGQFINADHADVIALSRDYGLELLDRTEWQGRSLVLDGHTVLSEERLVTGLRAIAAQIAADAALLDEDMEEYAPRFDALSVAAYLDRHAALLPDRRLRGLLEAGIRTEFGQEAHEATAIALLFNLPTVDGTAFEPIGTSDERFVLAGGSGRLADALARDVMAECSTGRALRSVEPSEGGVRLRFVDGASVEAAQAIITVPASVLRTIDFGGLLAAPWRSYVAEADCGRCEKLNAAYVGRPWAETMGRKGAIWPASGFAEAWEATTVEGPATLMTYYMGGDQGAAARSGTPLALRDRFEALARPAIPGLTAARAPWQRRTAWSQDRYARGAYSCFRPGQLTRFAPLFWVEGDDGHATQMAASGPLVFAGEHLSESWPGFMNGGAQTGRLAAEAALARHRMVRGSG